MADIKQKFTFDAKSAINQLNALTVAMTRANSALGNLAANTNAFNNIGNASGKAAKNVSLFQRSLNGLKGVALGALSVGIGQMLPQIARGFGNAAEAARKYGLQIAEIQTLAQDLNLTNAQVSDRVKELARELGRSPEDVAGGLYQVLQNNVVKAADSFIFLAQAQKLAVTTQATTAEAVDALSSVMKSYNLNIEDTERISGVLFETVNLGRVRLDEIADRIGRILPMSHQLGVSFEEVGAAIATMTVQGVKADTAITQFRAILSKLLKPTEEMQRLFQQWGVVDAKAAFQAFGGVNGVLQKMTIETEGSSQEMSKLLNVVRAQTGAFGLATDNFKLYTDNIAAMEKASTRAAEAWEIFKQSDAQTLTVQINQVKTAFLDMGEQAIPVINRFMQFFSGAFENTKNFSLWVASLRDANVVFEEGRKRLEDLIDVQTQNKLKPFVLFDERQWKVQEEAVRATLAGLQSEFNQMNKQNGAKIKASTDGFKGMVKNLSNAYKDSYKGLTDFVSSAESTIQGTSYKIAELRNEIGKVKFDRQLKSAMSDFRRFELLMGKSRQLQADANAKAQRAGLNKDARKEAEAVSSAALGYARQASALAETLGLRNKVQEAQAKEDAILRDQIGHQEQLRRLTQANLPGAKETLQNLETATATFESVATTLGMKLDDLRKRGATMPKEQRKQLEAEIGGLVDQLKGFDFTDSGRFMDQLNIPNTMKTIEKEFTGALERGFANWQADMTRLEQVAENFGKISFAKFDPDGTVTKLIESLGIEPDLSKGPAGAYNKALDAAKELLKLQDQLNKDATQAQGGINKNTAEVAKGAEENIQTNIGVFDNLIKGQILRGGVPGAKGTFPNVTAEAGTEAAKQLGALYVVEQKVRDLVPRLQELFKQASQAGGLTGAGQEELLSINQTIGALVKKKEISEELGRSVSNYVDVIRDRSDAEAKLAQATKAADQNLGKFQAAQALVDGLQQVPAAVDALQKHTETLKTSLSDSATNAAQIGTNAQNSVTGLTNAATAASTLANELERAAKAKAAAAGGGLFAGGIARLAAGGRGPDTINAQLAKGEFVSSARTTARFFSELNAMNNGSRPVYREQGGSVTNVGDINVTVQGGDTGRDTVREIGNALRREIQRGTLKLK